MAKTGRYTSKIGQYAVEEVLSEYMDRSYMVTCRCRVVVMSLISHPYGDSSAPYLGTAILTILYFRHLLITRQIYD